MSDWPIRLGAGMVPVIDGSGEMFVRNEGERDHISYRYDGHWQCSTLPAYLPSLKRVVSQHEANAAFYDKPSSQ